MKAKSLNTVDKADQLKKNLADEKVEILKEKKAAKARKRAE